MSKTLSNVLEAPPIFGIALLLIVHIAGALIIKAAGFQWHELHDRAIGSHDNSTLWLTWYNKSSDCYGVRY
jgi:hypothetical protein